MVITRATEPTPFTLLVSIATPFTQADGAACNPGSEVRAFVALPVPGFEPLLQRQHPGAASYHLRGLSTFAEGSSDQIFLRFLLLEAPFTQTSSGKNRLSLT